jgi:predicted aspartyl protease
MREKKPAVDKITAFAAAAMVFIFSASLYGANAGKDAAEKFRRTDFYSSGKLFDSASISGQGNLILEASEKFTAMKPEEKNEVSIEAAALWKKISGIKAGSVLVEIYEPGKRSSLWKSDGEDSAVMIEQWGPEILPEPGRSVFMSAAISGNSAQSGPSISGTFGTYFFKNILDCAVNLSASGSSAEIGLSGRCHYQLNPRWDINGGIGLSVSGGGGSATGEMLFLVGASEFLSYRSSLDFSASIGTSGGIMLGSGVTYYFDRSPLSGEGSLPVQRPAADGGRTKPEPAATNTAEEISTPETATPVATFTRQPEDTIQPTNTPQPADTQPAVEIPQSVITQTAIETPQPANTQPVVETQQPVDTQTAIETPQPVSAQQAVETPQRSNTQQATATAQSIPTAQATDTPWVASISEINGTKIPTPVETPAVQAAITEKEATPEPVKAETDAASSTPVNETAENKSKGTTAGFFIEVDSLNMAESLSNNWQDISGRLGYGDDGIFGMSLIPEFRADNYHMTPLIEMYRLDLALDFYPFGRSPSGLYLGPLIGARYYTYNSDPHGMYSFMDNELEFSYGGEAGIRLLANWLVIDVSAAYYNKTQGNAAYLWPDDNIINNISIRAEAGLMFYAQDKKNNGAGGEQGAAESNRSGEGEKTGTSAGVFLEADTMSIERSIQNGWDELNCRFGFGDDGIFGMSFILNGKYYEDSVNRYYTPGLSIALDFYPGDHSPSRLYLGPLFGARCNLTGSASDTLDISDNYAILTLGGEAGVRIMMNWFMIDIGAEYDYNTNLYRTKYFTQSNEFIYRAGVGFMFYDSSRSR